MSYGLASATRSESLRVGAGARQLLLARADADGASAPLPVMNRGQRQDAHARPK